MSEIGCLGGDRGQDLLDGGHIAGRPRTDLDDVASGTVLQLIGGAGVDDVAVVDDDHVASQMVGLLQILGGEEHVDAVGDELANGVPQFPPAPWVQAGRGLVEEEQTRSTDEAGPEIQAPAHPARIRADEAIGSIRQPQPLEYLAGGTRATRGGKARRGEPRTRGSLGPSSLVQRMRTVLRGR